MSRVKQKSDGRGSLKGIQILINKNQNVIDNLIKGAVSELRDTKINWKSPLMADDYAEYRDNDFLKIVGLKLDDINLANFWPSRGPQWDALASTSNGHIILVEAKANLPELKSGGTQAKEPSKSKIDAALKETKDFMGVNNEVDWSKSYYQYTNRLAHLYFLKKVSNIPTYLVNVYFINDESVRGPKSVGEWQIVIDKMKNHLGITNHNLSEYVVDLFVDMKTLIN